MKNVTRRLFHEQFAFSGRNFGLHGGPTAGQRNSVRRDPEHLGQAVPTLFVELPVPGQLKDLHQAL